MPSALRRILVAAAAVAAMASAANLANAQSIAQSQDTRQVYPQGGVFMTHADTLTATGAGGWLGVAGTGVEVQFSGVATSLSGQLQRSSINPAVGTADWAPVGTAQSTVNPSTGVAPITATETGLGWYRYNVTGLTGASVNITITGKAY